MSKGGPTLHQAISPGRVAARLGEDIARSGFQPVPDVLLFHQVELGLRSEDLNVLLHILAHWYVPERMPYLHPHSIAKRMGDGGQSAHGAEVADTPT